MVVGRRLGRGLLGVARGLWNVWTNEGYGVGLQVSALVLVGGFVGSEVRWCGDTISRSRSTPRYAAVASAPVSGGVVVRNPFVPLSVPVSALEDIASGERGVVVSSVLVAGREWKVQVSVADYLRCKGGDHAPKSIGDYLTFVTPEDVPLVSIAKAITADCLTVESRSSRILEFVHQFVYVEDRGGEYVKFPLETIVEGGGDCEDLSILGASMIRAVGGGVSLLYFKNVLPDTKSHFALGVTGNFTGTCWSHDGKEYYFAEATGTEWTSKPSKRAIGDIPAEYKRAATIFVVK